MRMMRSLMPVLLTAVTLMAFGSDARATESGAPVEAIASVLSDYGRIHEALAADRTEGVVEAARTIALTAKGVVVPAESKQAWDRLAASAATLTGSDLESLRGQLDALSRAVAGILDAKSGGTVQLYYCPMKGAYWLQAKGDASRRNPYFGKAMLGCGEKADRVED